MKMLKSPKYSKMSVTLLEVLMQMVRSLDSPSKRYSMQRQLDRLGVTHLVVDLISYTDDTLVFDRCIELGITLLDGMNAQVQYSNNISYAGLT